MDGDPDREIPWRGRSYVAAASSMTWPRRTCRQGPSTRWRSPRSILDDQAAANLPAGSQQRNDARPGRPAGRRTSTISRGGDRTEAQGIQTDQQIRARRSLGPFARPPFYSKAPMSSPVPMVNLFSWSILISHFCPHHQKSPLKAYARRKHPASRERIGGWSARIPPRERAGTTTAAVIGW